MLAKKIIELSKAGEHELGGAALVTLKTLSHYARL
jgi:hypothetical protein